MLEEARSIGCIDFKLPPLHSTSGVVLTRAVGSMENLFLKHYPMIFKVGFCHDPVFRWCNSLYGYSTAKDKWTTLCVLYMSDEPYSVSMLEAALIEKYRSILTYIIYCIHCFALCDFLGFEHVWHIPAAKPLPFQGKPGCRNIKSGGDNVQLKHFEWNAYMCYVVFRSFKEKPQA